MRQPQAFMWGRSPDLRPAFLPACAPFTHCPPFHPIAPPAKHAARLATPAVAPAEQHPGHLYRVSKRHPPPRLAAWPARLRAPPQAAAAKWSMPPGLPHRQSCRWLASGPFPSAAMVQAAFVGQTFLSGNVETPEAGRNVGRRQERLPHKRMRDPQRRRMSPDLRATGCKGSSRQLQAAGQGASE